MVVDLGRADESIIIEVEGELDLASAPRLREGLVQALATHDGIALELDLSGVDFVDCAGWRPVIDAAGALRESGGRVAIVATSPPVERLVELVGLVEGVSFQP